MSQHAVLHLDKEEVLGQVVSASCTAPEKSVGFLFYADGVELLEVSTKAQSVAVKLTLPASGVFNVHCEYIPAELSNKVSVASYEVRLRLG